MILENKEEKERKKEGKKRTISYSRPAEIGKKEQIELRGRELRVLAYSVHAIKKLQNKEEKGKRKQEEYNQ